MFFLAKLIFWPIKWVPQVQDFDLPYQQATIQKSLYTTWGFKIASGDLEIHGFEILKIRVSNLAWGFWDFSYFSESWEYGFEIFRISTKFENMVSRFPKKIAPAARKLIQFLKEIVDLPLKYPKILACGAKMCVQAFEIFRKFQNL